MTPSRCDMEDRCVRQHDDTEFNVVQVDGKVPGAVYTVCTECAEAIEAGRLELRDLSAAPLVAAIRFARDGDWELVRRRLRQAARLLRGKQRREVERLLEQFERESIG